MPLGLATRKELRRKLHPRRFQKLFVVEKWNLMNPQGNEWNLLYLQNTKIALQTEVLRRWPFTILVHKFIPMPQAMKILDAKAAVDKEWKKLETIPARQLETVKSKTEVILEAQRDKKKVHCATLMDICHLKNSDLEPQFQKYKGGIVLRGHIVKDDSGACAVFTEQASSASQMTAAKVMDVIAQLPVCDGQAADAISAYTQVKMEDAQKTTQNSKVRCPDVWIRLPRHKWPKLSANI